MQTQRYRQRIASIFLTLFLGLLLLATAHDFSHRTEVGQPHRVEGNADYTAQLQQASCELCQYIHTPFLDLSESLVLPLATVLLCLFLVCAVDSFTAPRILHTQLRAPPVVA